MKNTSFRVEDVFGDALSRDCISPEQITKPNISSAQNVNINIKIKFNFFKSRKEKYFDIQPSAPPCYKSIFVNINGFKSNLLCWWKTIF